MELTALPANDPRKIKAIKLVTRATAVVRSYLVREQYKKIKFIATINNKKAH